MATVTANPNFNPDTLAKQLRDAMKGLGTNEKAIIEVLNSVVNVQRQQIIDRYNTDYGRNLIEDLKAELGGSFEAGVLALMETPAVYDACSLRSAMKGAGTDEATIIEILATRSDAEIAAIKAAYHGKFNRDLEHDLKSETSGAFSHLLISLSQGKRNESTAVDKAKAQADAKALYEAGEKAWGTDESEFNRVFMTSSAAQLRAVCDEYHNISKNDLHAVIQKEMSGSLERAYFALIETARDPAQYFADRVHHAIAGAGTDEAALIRVIVSRSEKDLLTIEKAYQTKYKKEMRKDVESEVSGDLKRLLSALLQ